MKINRFLLIAGFIATLAHAQVSTIAVLEIVPSGDMELKLSEYRHLTDELRARAREALPRSGYTVLTRDNILSLMPPDTEEAQCLAESCAVDIGRAIGAEYVTQGFVGEFSGMMTLTVELYEAISGNLLGSFVTESSTVMGLLKTIREKAPDLFKTISQTSSNKPTTQPTKQKKETENRSLNFSFQPSIRIGLNMAFMKLLILDEEYVDGDYIDVEKEIDTDNSIGFHAGITFDFPLVDIGIGIFSLQPGIIFTQKGGIWTDEYFEEGYYGDYSGKSEVTFSINYLEIPLVASLKIPINESLAVRANAGFYVAFGLFGTLKNEYTECYIDECESYSDEDDIFKDFKNLDYGLSFSGGVEINNFYVGVAYGLGLCNIFTENQAEVTNRSLSFTLGYNF